MQWARPKAPDYTQCCDGDTAHRAPSKNTLTRVKLQLIQEHQHSYNQSRTIQIATGISMGTEPVSQLWLEQKDHPWVQSL